MNDTTDAATRRNVLKRIGAAGAVSLGGVAAFSGTAAAFSDGERVTPTANLNTRYRPGTESRVLATIAPGTEGEIMNGPVSEDGYTWWGVHWLEDDIWGWSAGEYLKSTSSGGGGGGGDADFTWPISGIVTSPYGTRDGGFHSGVDIDGGDIGAPVYAARGGVAGTYYGDSYGNFIVIDHGSDYITEYGHLNDFTISDGEQVERGQQIGEMGSTGNSTGPHLHLTIELNNETQPIPASDGETLTVGEPIPEDYSGI